MKKMLIEFMSWDLDYIYTLDAFSIRAVFFSTVNADVISYNS